MYEIFELLLKSHNITAYKVSKETGITQSTLSDWKRGRSTPKTDNMKKIADYFGVSIEYLMTGKEPETSATKFKPTTIAAHLDIEDLTETELEDIADYIEYVKNKRKK